MTTRSPQLSGRSVGLAAATAAVQSGLVYLLEHFVFHDDWGWIGVPIFFFVLFPINVGAPWIRRFFRGPQTAVAQARRRPQAGSPEGPL